MAEITDFFGKASIDTDYAVATTVENDRTAGVTVLEAIDLSKFTEDTPVFFVTYKKTTDPLTGEVSVSDLVSYKGLVNSGANTITNLTVAPGYVDIGNEAGDFVECIPTSYWVNSLIDGIFVGFNPDGSMKANAPVDSPQGTLANITPVGSILDFAGTAAPTGWLLAYGQTLDADANPEYQDLYDVIGNTYGGSDNSDFVVPDLRGRVAAGKDNMGGSSANRLTDATTQGVNGDTLGDTGGEEAHVQTLAELRAHTHQSGRNAGSSGSFGIVDNAAASSSGQWTTGSAGSSAAFNVLQPTIILNKIIKY